MLTLRTHTGQEVPYPKPQAKATFNETTADGISWAAWSWNPVTGCLHGCDYCYARAIANRFTNAFPAGFTPLFHHERLDAPTNTVIPAAHRDDPAYRRVFVCSMADLYGRWVPDEWIEPGPRVDAGQPAMGIPTPHQVPRPLRRPRPAADRLGRDLASTSRSASGSPRTRSGRSTV